MDSDILGAYKRGETKVLIAVDKLNEGIDMPNTNNIVFRRNTDSATVFQQQFGRGLRGEKVNIYDYVGGLRNMAWIQDINNEIDSIVSSMPDADKQVSRTDKRINVRISDSSTKNKAKDESSTDRSYTQ